MIGLAKPVSLMVDTFGTGIVPDELLADILLRHMELTPAAVIETLALREPVYRSAAAYGHASICSQRG